jgi:hypothetical protein
LQNVAVSAAGFLAIAVTRGGYAMIQVNSGQASGERHGSSRWQFGLHIDCRLITVAAILTLASFNVTTRAYAQSEEDVASCVDKCSKDQKQCIYNQSSEELCDYDYKMCKKACNEKK